MIASAVTPEMLVKVLPDIDSFPIEQWHPKTVGDIAIYIDADGQWFYQGTPFIRKKMIRLFSRLLRKEGDHFYLVTPVEKLQVRVEDVPFVIVDVEFAGSDDQKTITFTTSIGDTCILSERCPLHVVPEHLSKNKIFKPYVRIRHALEAKVNRNVFYQLVEKSEQYEEQYGVWSDGQFWLLEDQVAD